MIRRFTCASLMLLAAFVVMSSVQTANVEAGGVGQPTDWSRFYHYPYVYYPHNFQKPVEYDHLYYRYPQERRIPVYNKDWHNFYPTKRPYHGGMHFIMDVF